MTSRKNVTQKLVLAALMAALTAICSQMLIPLPLVPINLALFAVHLTGALLGAQYGALSIIVYVLPKSAAGPLWNPAKTGTPAAPSNT